MTTSEMLEELVNTQLLEVEKNLVVSSAHITERDNEVLCTWDNDRHAPFTVYALPDWVLINLDDSVLELTELSESFKTLYTWAVNRPEGFSFLKVDRDGPVLSGFAVHEW